MYLLATREILIRISCNTKEEEEGIKWINKASVFNIYFILEEQEKYNIYINYVYRII